MKFVDRVEYFDPDGEQLTERESSIVPRVGDIVTIQDLLADEGEQTMRVVAIEYELFTTNTAALTVAKVTLEP